MAGCDFMLLSTLSGGETMMAFVAYVGVVPAGHLFSFGRLHIRSLSTLSAKKVQCHQ